jgi:hypothetical protein
MNSLNFKTIDIDLFTSIVSISSYANMKEKTLYTNFSLILNETINSDFMCLPKSELFNVANLPTDCTNDFLLIAQNNILKCDDCTFNYTKLSSIYSEYYFATGCINGNKFTFSYIDDRNGVKFVSYKQNKFDLSSRCINRAIGCSGTQPPSECSRTRLNIDCNTILNNNCKQIFQDMDKLKPNGVSLALYPPECDYMTSESNKTIKDKCFPWISNKFISDGFVFNRQNLTEIDSQLYSFHKPLRFLQTNLITKIVSLDLTTNDKYFDLFRNVTFNDSLINISGSTPNSIADTNSFINDINANNTNITSTQNNSGSLINIPMCIIVSVIILII